MSDQPTQPTDWAAWLRDNAPPGPLGRNMVSAANELDRLRTALHEPSTEDLDVAASCLEGEASRPWHIHPADRATVLRVAAWIRHRISSGCPTPGACSAVDEIERLRAALAQIAGPINPDKHGTALHERMRQIAREALS